MALWCCSAPPRLPERRWREKSHPLLPGSNAVLHALSRYGNAVLDRTKIDESKLDEDARIASTG
jgi:hypothetical protein